MQSAVSKKIKELYGAQGWNQDELAKRVGTYMLAINHLINGKRKMTPDMAVKFEQVSEFGMTAEDWMKLQTDEDIVWARQALEEEAMTKVGA